MSQAYQTAVNLIALLMMPGIKGVVQLQVPGMTMDNMDAALAAIRNTAKMMCPLLKDGPGSSGNVFRAELSDLTVYLTLPK